MRDLFTSERVSDEYILLNSCGTETFDHKSSICNRENGRMDYHILYILKGQCTIMQNGEERIIESNNLILYRPGEKQIYKFTPDNVTTSMYIHFTGSGCEELLKQANMDTGMVFHMERNPIFEKTFAELEQAFFYKHSGNKMLCNAYLMLILAIIGKSLGEIQNRFSAHDVRIERSCTKIYIRYNKPLDIDVLASYCYLSVSRFNHLFRKVTGYSPTEFQRHIRIEKSKQLLENNSYSISEIATEVGYDNQNYFSRIFRKSAGISPREYRYSLHNISE